MAKANKTKEKDVEAIDINSVGDNLPELDQEAIKITEERILDKTEEMKGKVYSVRMTGPLLERLEDFINNKVAWANKEALGVIEVNKTLEETRKSGIKDGFVYMESLPLQATHYFVSKTTGNGLEEAKEHVELLKVLDEALERSTEDVRQLKALENELAGLQQGLKTE